MNDLGHETDNLNGRATYGPASPELFQLQSQRMRQVSGLLGGFFGDPVHAPSNIAGLALVLLFLFGAVVTFFQTSISAGEYWKIASPIITLILGYLFGKKG